jgi:predicted aspartyl protease
MPICDYPFLLPTKKGVRVGGPNAIPALWVKVSNPEKGLAVIALALIDTGAGECAFPANVAWRLGHDLYAVSPKMVHTANRQTTTFPHTSRVEVLDVELDGRPNEGKVLLAIQDQLIDYTCGLEAFLLGQRNFLGQFVLKIDYPKQRVSLRLPEGTKPKKAGRK